LHKEDYENGQLTNTTLVDSTVETGLATLTYEELLFTEVAVSVCGNLTGLRNATEIYPEKLTGTSSSEFVATVSFGHPVDAFFCNASNNQVPDPVLSQGDTIRVCIRLSKNSTYFHLEDIYTMALIQPTTGVMTHYAVYNGNSSEFADKNCQLGFCNILTQVPSRFFDQAFDRDSGPVRIVGVALLNVGPVDRRKRLLTPIEISGHRQLQTADVPRSAFELEAEIRGAISLDQGSQPTDNSDTNKGISSACILSILVTGILTMIVFVALRRRRKQEAARKPSEPLPAQPTTTPIMKIQEPSMRIFSQTTYPDRNPNPETARSA
jgi:hypothetical protein